MITKREAQLGAEYRQGTDAGTVLPFDAVGQYFVY